MDFSHYSFTAFIVLLNILYLTNAYTSDGQYNEQQQEQRLRQQCREQPECQPAATPSSYS
jgi:hypothetical protein